MLEYLTNNWPTLLVAAIVLSILVAAFAGLSRKNNSNGIGCGGNCSDCRNAGACADKDKKN